MGINGMVMTRDLFNQFVFLEIVSIATYGLLGFDRYAGGAGRRLQICHGHGAGLVLFPAWNGAALPHNRHSQYRRMIAHRATITGPIGTTALMLLLSSLIIELKPFPANGWGLDVYETAPSGVAALVSVGVSAGVFFALFKLLPLFETHLDIVALSGGDDIPVFQSHRPQARPTCKGCLATLPSRRWGC